MTGELALQLPPWRPARITAEVVVSKIGSPMYYVYADGMCIDQGISSRASDKTKSHTEHCIEHVREKWKIEPEVNGRR